MEISSNYSPTSDDEPLATRRRQDLGRFLRARRSALTPEALGIRRAQRRRSTGLLREEVAAHAGLSTTWYTWLEQGRDIRPSGALLERLASTLQLGDAERAHLFDLARPDLVSAPDRALSDAVPGSLTRWLAGLVPHPAYVHNGIWQVLAWNDAATRLFGDFGDEPELDRNILKLIFLNQRWRSLLIDWEQIATSSAAQFRAQTVHFAGSPAFADLLSDLQARSEDFARLWNAHTLDVPEIRTKRLAHPELGLLELDYASLKPSGAAEDLSVVIYSPAGSVE